MKGRLMALDYGSKRIGVALSDPLRVLARGWGVVPRDPEGEAHFAAIAAIIAEEAVTGLVLGLPRNADGSEGEMVELVRAFGSRLAELTGLELAYCDESFSSLEADEILRQKHRDPKKRKAERDVVAAQIILRHHLDFAR
ncbi:MAG: Holliday junction resolvase RuvX [Planctomycetes bacterium]|nr:Holliday junction resolvase RuvX [Planctomycetota bacterium]